MNLKNLSFLTLLLSAFYVLETKASTNPDRPIGFNSLEGNSYLVVGPDNTIKEVQLPYIVIKASDALPLKPDQHIVGFGTDDQWRSCVYILNNNRKLQVASLKGNWGSWSNFGSLQTLTTLDIQDSSREFILGVTNSHIWVAKILEPNKVGWRDMELYRQSLSSSNRVYVGKYELDPTDTPLGVGSNHDLRTPERSVSLYISNSERNNLRTIAFYFDPVSNYSVLRRKPFSASPTPLTCVKSLLEVAKQSN